MSRYAVSMSTAASTAYWPIWMIAGVTVVDSVMPIVMSASRLSPPMLPMSLFWAFSLLIRASVSRSSMLYSLSSSLPRNADATEFMRSMLSVA